MATLTGTSLTTTSCSSSSKSSSNELANEIDGSVSSFRKSGPLCSTSVAAKRHVSHLVAVVSKMWSFKAAPHCPIVRRNSSWISAATGFHSCKTQRKEGKEAPIWSCSNGYQPAWLVATQSKNEGGKRKKEEEGGRRRKKDGRRGRRLQSGAAPMATSQPGW